MPIALILIIAGVLASPILWFVVSALCTQFPPAAEFLSKVFWQVFGNVPFFESAASILEQALSYEQFSGSHFFLSFLSLLGKSVMDSFIMGLCMFAVKSIFARFSRKGLLIIPASTLVTALGIVIGVLLTMGINVVPISFQGLFSFLFCIGLFMFGFGMMLGKPFRMHYSDRRTMAIVKMLIKILVDANLAWCYVALVVCTMEGPRIVQQTGNFKIWLAWYGAILLLYIILDSIIFFMSPEGRNSV